MAWTPRSQPFDEDFAYLLGTLLADSVPTMVDRLWCLSSDYNCPILFLSKIFLAYLSKPSKSNFADSALSARC